MLFRSSVPFFVRGDTTKPELNITFDGNEIFDGEYVSTNPDIKIELNEIGRASCRERV